MSISPPLSNAGTEECRVVIYRVSQITKALSKKEGPKICLTGAPEMVSFSQRLDIKRTPFLVQGIH